MRARCTRRLACALAASSVWLSSCGEAPRREDLAYGRFEHVELSVPRAPSSAVLLLADGTSRARADTLTARLSHGGALVARLDAEAFRRLLDQTTSGCVSPAGDLDNLARFVQAYAGLKSYRPAILLGLGAGAGVVAGALSQAPSSTFAGAIVLDDCGEPASTAPLCPRAEPAQDLPPLVRLRAPDAACGDPASAPGAPPDGDAARLPAELARLAARARAHAVAAATNIGDLPVIEVAASGGVSEVFALFLSGDGGWAGFDEALSHRLAARGIPVVGFDSLRYFWRARTPDGTAADVQQLIEHYSAAWKRGKVVMIGFSQGADVLPFILNRLAPVTRARIVGAVALSISTQASFEFHLRNWLGPSGDVPTMPEVQRLGREVLYVCGSADAEALCSRLDPTVFRVASLPGGHHVDAAYDTLIELILGASSSPR